MYRIAAMGDRDSIYGFASIGLDIFPAPVEDPQAAAATLRKLAESDYAVIYMTEGLAAVLEADIDKYRDTRTPAIILIPGVSGNTGAGMRNVGKAVEKAVGSDILSDS